MNTANKNPDTKENAKKKPLGASKSLQMVSICLKKILSAMARQIEFLDKIHQMEEQNKLRIKNIELKIDNLTLKISAGKSEV